MKPNIQLQEQLLFDPKIVYNTILQCSYLVPEH